VGGVGGGEPQLTNGSRHTADPENDTGGLVGGGDTTMYMGAGLLDCKGGGTARVLKFQQD